MPRLRSDHHQHLAVALSDTARVTESASWTARTTNAALTRRRELEGALTAVETGVAANNVSTAQSALKQALEAIHELSDCLARGEWTQDGWTADDRGLWYAHVGARNAAHHESAALAALHSDGDRDYRLVWEMPVSVRSVIQTTEYRTRLSGLRVLPALRDRGPSVRSCELSAERTRQHLDLVRWAGSSNCRADCRATRPERRNPPVQAGFGGTATGIRTPVSAVRGRRPSPLDDSGAGPALRVATARHFTRRG